MDLANYARNEKKPTKKEAQAILRLLREKHDDVDIRSLAKLYNWFMPPIPKKVKTDWDWVCKAVAPKDEPRFYLRYVYVAKDRVVATDGRRLHVMVNIGNLSDGYYLTNGDPVDVDAVFPEWERVIPHHGDLHKSDVSLKACELVKAGNGFSLAYKIGSKGYQKKYIDDAVNGADEFVIQDTSSESSASLIEYEGRTAVVMPIRL